MCKVKVVYVAERALRPRHSEFPMMLWVFKRIYNTLEGEKKSSNKEPRRLPSRGRKCPPRGSSSLAGSSLGSTLTPVCLHSSALTRHFTFCFRSICSGPGQGESGLPTCSFVVLKMHKFSSLGCSWPSHTVWASMTSKHIPRDSQYQ